MTARLGFGSAPLGNLYREVADDDAAAAVDAAWDCGVRYFDAAPLYGHGLAERRLGAALAGRPRDQYRLSTKVGRLLVDGHDPDSIFVATPPMRPVFDFSADGVKRSLEASLRRLGTDRVDVALVHDPDEHMDQALSEAIPVLSRLRDEGTVGAIGAGMNNTGPLARLVRQADLDTILVAGRWNLLDRSAADELLPLCVERGVEVVVGGVFKSGVLAGPDGGATCDYHPASPVTLARARAMQAACARFGVDLPTAAICFAGRHPAVSVVLVGARTAGEVRQAASALETDIPEALWQQPEFF